MSNERNPLISKSKNFDDAIDFNLIKISDYEPAIEYWISKSKERIHSIIHSKEAPNFANTIACLESATDELDHTSLIFGNLEIANGDDSFHELAKKLYPKLADFSSDITLNNDLFSKVKFVYDHEFKKDHLTTEQKKLLEKTYTSFVRNGALLDESKKAQLREIDQKLSVLGPKFSENVLKATNDFEYLATLDELTGLPENALEAAAEMATAKGKTGYLISLQLPSYLPIISYAQNRELREKIFKAYGRRAYGDKYDNQIIIKDILKFRSKRARLLGFVDHANFILSERMAQSPDMVFAFLNKIKEASKKSAEKDLTEVAALAFEMDGINDFQPWDFAYYSEKLKEKKYAFNEEELRPYFKLENVILGIFKHAELLYDIKFNERKDLPVYHVDVKVYEIFDKDNSYLGLFYTDFFPRETKKGGAWMTQFREQGLTNGVLKRPHVSIVCNFTKPTSTKPSLLSYDEVRTFFHEFGHALHGILSNCQHRTLAGPNVLWDFVELPSQIMENWVNEKQSLDLYARHYETGELMPTDLIEKLNRSQKFLAGWMSLRQVQFGILDMNWHTIDPELINNIDEIEERSTQECRLLPKIKGTNVSCSFSHIFAGGYSAGYYSYKWAEVLDADAFDFFKEKGIFNKHVSTLFKTHILSKGGTEFPMDLYKKFRGREPDPDALLRRDGLI